MVAEQTGARVVKLPIGADRLPDLTQLPTLLNDKTRLLALGQMSNVTGGCPDLAPAIALAHAAGARVMIDGAQGVVHGPADVQRLDIDFYAFSGHKLYGPTGIGALYGKAELLAQMAPWQGGGKMLTQASFDGFTPQNRRTARSRHAEHRRRVGVGRGAHLAQRAGHGGGGALQPRAGGPGGTAVGAAAGLSQLPQLRLQPAGVRYRRRTPQRHRHAVGGARHCAARRPTLRAAADGGVRRQRHAARIVRPYNTQQDVDTLVSALTHALDLLAD